MKSRFIARLLVVSLTWLVAMSGSSAIAQNPLGEIVVDLNDEVAVAPNVFELQETNFYRWIFGNTTNSATPREHLEALLLLSIGEVDRSCTLTEAQKNKLLLAGRGDIKHFLDRVADAHKVFDELRHDQKSINTIHQETLPLAATLRVGLFGNGSIISKSIMSTLEPEQATHYRNFLIERNQFRHQAKIELAILNMDLGIGLTHDQRKRLIDLVMKETRPSERPIPQYELQVVMFKISKIPEAKIREILDESRFKALTHQLLQVRGLEAFFNQNGYLDESEPAAFAPPDQIGN